MSLLARFFKSREAVVPEVVLDPREGLMWQRTHAPQKMTHDEAYAYCKSLRLDNHADWVLPTLGQMRRLLLSHRLRGEVSQADDVFWTSTPSDHSPTTAACVSDGRSLPKTERCYVRAVRHL